MRLENHIAWRYFNDPKLIDEMLFKTYPDLLKVPITEDMHNRYDFKYATSFYAQMQHRKEDRSYYITNTVLGDKLKMLKVKKKPWEGGYRYDWRVFSDIKNGRYTFVLPDNRVIRMSVEDEVLAFVYMFFSFKPGSNLHGELRWEMFNMNRVEGWESAHVSTNNVQSILDELYRLLCFIFLCENDEVVLQPGQKHGTQKTEKIINTLRLPLTIVNSRWNTKVIMQESFGVRGHFAIRWTGAGRTMAKMVWVEPFVKHGYTRQAKSGNNT